jgi:hypothetical protein
VGFLMAHVFSMRRATEREVFSFLLFYHSPSSLSRVCPGGQRTDEAREEKERSRDASEWAKRNGLGKNRHKRKTGESSGGFEREVERLNERGRKPMKNNFHRWGGGRASIAGEPLLPGQSPMSTLCSGGEWRGMRLRVNKRFCRAKGDEHCLCPEKLHPLLSDLAAWPITPAHRLSRNRRGIWRGWRISGGRRRAFPIGDQGSTCGR